MMQHQNPAMRNFMRYVSLLGDWPLHAAVGLVLLGLAWRRGSEQWTRIFLAMLLAMLLAGVAGTVIKRTVPRARPSVHDRHTLGRAAFQLEISLVSIRTCWRFDRVLWRFTYRASARRPCVPRNPDSDRVLADVHRRPLSLRRRLRSGSGNFVRACRRRTSYCCQSDNRQSAIEN